MINHLSVSSSSLPSFENLPVEILERILTLCNRSDILNLLTLSSKVFPIIAKKIWHKQCLDHNFLKSELDFRRILFFQGLNHIKKARITSMLPYLQYITDLNIYQLSSRDQILILRSVHNCKSLSIWWSPRIASVLLDAKNIAPFLSTLRIPNFSELYESKKDTKMLKEIIENRALYLSNLMLKNLPFCSYSILSTVLVQTKVKYFECDLHPLLCDERTEVDEASKFSLSGSPFLNTCALHLSELYPSPPLDFFNWVHSSPYLTTLILTLNFNPSADQGLFYAFLNFFLTFPASSPLKKLTLFNLSLGTRMSHISKFLLPSNRVNTSLKSLKIFFDSESVDRSSDILIQFMKFFSHLKCLEVYYYFSWYSYASEYQRSIPLKLDQFLCKLSSFNLVKLKMDLPNRLQRFILPVLKNMTSLREVDLRLDAGLLYQFIPQLPQITLFIFRSFRRLNFRVFVNGKFLDLLTNSDSEGPYFLFNRNQLELIRNAPSRENLFQATFF